MTYGDLGAESPFATTPRLWARGWCGGRAGSRVPLRDMIKPGSRGHYRLQTTEGGIGASEATIFARAFHHEGNTTGESSFFLAMKGIPLMAFHHEGNTTGRILFSTMRGNPLTALHHEGNTTGTCYFSSPWRASPLRRFTMRETQQGNPVFSP